MKVPNQLDDSSFKSLFGDIKKLCTDEMYKEFLSLLYPLVKDLSHTPWNIQVGYSTAVDNENGMRYPVYILIFTKNDEKHYILLYVNSDANTIINTIFKVTRTDTLIML